MLKKTAFMKSFKKQFELQVFAIIGIIFLIIFSYIPMAGIIIAFKDYKLTSGLLGMFTSEWVGLKYFREFVNDINFTMVVRNTIAMSMLKLVFTFPIPILFAIALNEVGNQKVKRVVQTVSYLPHFISWVVVYGMIFSFFNQQNGLINQLLVKMGLISDSLLFLAEAEYFLPLVILSDIWKGMGWWAIIFLAAISSVDPCLYEAAIVDGAGRIRRIWNITLPSIKGTIIIVLILSLGNLLGGGLGGSNFDQAYLIGNKANFRASEILQTYTLRMGLAQGRFAYAAAIGLLQSVISVILIYSSNFFARKITGEGL